MVEALVISLQNWGEIRQMSILSAIALKALEDLLDQYSIYFHILVLRFSEIYDNNTYLRFFLCLFHLDPKDH